MSAGAQSPLHTVTLQDRGWAPCTAPCATPLPGSAALHVPLAAGAAGGREMVLGPGLTTSAQIPVMGCAPPTLPTAGKEARLGWTAMEKQAGRAARPVLPGAVPVRAWLHVRAVEVAHHRGASRVPQGRDKTVPRAVPRALAALCQPCPHLTDTTGVPNGGAEPQAGAAGPGGGARAVPSRRCVVQERCSAGAPSRQWDSRWERPHPTAQH